MTHESEAPISFSATTTLDDIVVASAHLRKSLRKKTSRLAWRPFIVPGLMIVGFVGGSMSASDDPTATFKQLLTTKFGVQTVLVLLLISLMGLLARRALRLANKIATRRIYAGMRRLHPATDTRDAALRMPRVYRFDEWGMTTATAYDEIREGWPRITGLDETDKLLIVRIGGTTGYPLPKAQLPNDMPERLHLFIAARSHSKWPF